MTACCVYVIGPVGGLYKIGISQHPRTRLSQIRHIEGPAPELLAVYERASNSEARGVERAAHRALRPFRVSGEWFEITPDQATAAVEAAIAATERGDYADTRRTWGVKKMPTRTAWLIRRAAQIEGVNIADWLERFVLTWQARQVAPVEPPKGPATPE